MKLILLTFALLITEVLYCATPDMSDTIEKDFRNAFPKAEQVKWYKTDLMYEVVFINDQVSCRMRFLLNGTIDRTIRYYTEEHLPPFILSKIKRKFAGKKVYGVTEDTSEDGVTYYIVLEDEDHWLHIQSDAIGNTIITNQYKKNRNVK
ncbi:hypothetical protein OCK74_01685 [Chitinophagaceae bacterium LB-8]|uniref:Beta-lactamase-inhibitor-like PepSY-like domain-containing protein n=1 Tax=Paraflavisolibacter caeni TaxID=2982496 RepID=A0A9X2XT41_9BACT|nr:hypothetical protein [Paraflavisolibacter caeni]MCU7547801.1 hypothetical protein [Paraflavisolibacter caeni]